MIWFFIEMGVALLLAVLIVWWTLPRRRDRSDGEGKDSEKGARSSASQPQQAKPPAE